MNMEFLNDPKLRMLAPKILEPMSLQLVGCVFYGNPFHAAKEWSYENEIGHLWNRFINIYKKYQFILEKLNIDSENMFEVHLEPEEFAKTRQYYVFVGISIDYLAELPIVLFLKPLPYVSYLQFTTKAKDHDSAEYLFKKWLMARESSYEQAYPFVIQRYNQKRYQGLEDPNSEIDWMIPIGLKESKGDVSKDSQKKTKKRERK